jgi:hypothetical protein
VSEDAHQEKMSFVDVEKYIKDGVEYTVTYQASGLATCERDEPEPKIPFGPGAPGWVSYKMTFSVQKPSGNLKIKSIKISPHSKAGEALVKS